MVQRTVRLKTFFSSLSKDEIFIIEDMNFDKKTVIWLMRFFPAAANISYYYWIFNNLIKKFERIKSLQQITSPEFDPKTELIFFCWPGSCRSHGQHTNKYINRKPVLIQESEVAQDLNDSTKYIITLNKRIRGEKCVLSKCLSKRKALPAAIKQFGSLVS